MLDGSLNGQQANEQELEGQYQAAAATELKVMLNNQFRPPKHNLLEPVSRISRPFPMAL